MELDIFINEWLNSWTGNRPDVLLSYYADDAFYLDPANPTGIAKTEELRVYFSKLLVKNPNWIWEAIEIISTPKGCILKWKAEIPVGEKRLTLFGLDIIEILAGKITRNEVYFDRIPWIEAIQRQHK